MFEWLTNIFGSILGLPILIITACAGLFLPKWVTWVGFIALCLFVPAYLTGFESGIETVRGWIGV